MQLAQIQFFGFACLFVFVIFFWVFIRQKQLDESAIEVTSEIKLIVISRQVSKSSVGYHIISSANLVNLANGDSIPSKVIRAQTEQFLELFSRTLNFFAP